MIRFRPLPILTVLAVMALTVLILFGRWQWEKYVRESAEADAPALEVTLEGYQPIEDGLQLVYGVAYGAPGWRIFAPIRQGERVMFVDAGFAPGPTPPNWRELEFPGALRFGEQMVGIAVDVRAAGPLAPRPDPEARTWFSIEPEAMAAAAGIEGPIEAQRIVAVPYLGEDGRPQPNPFATARLDATPPEQHLGYAITWWGLALVLVGVYIAYHGSSGRLRFGAGKA